jgi:hypothetical protein
VPKPAASEARPATATRNPSPESSLPLGAPRRKAVAPAVPLGAQPPPLPPPSTTQ